MVGWATMRKRHLRKILQDRKQPRTIVVFHRNLVEVLVGKRQGGSGREIRETVEELFSLSKGQADAQHLVVTKQELISQAQKLTQDNQRSRSEGCIQLREKIL